MNKEAFNAAVNRQMDRSLKLLSDKGVRYASDEDKLHNFQVAATLQGTTQSKALAGMLAKHTVKLYDMMASDSYFSMEDWHEVITDHVNYLLILAAILENENLAGYAVPLTDVLAPGSIRESTEKPKVWQEKEPWPHNVPIYKEKS